ncbi:hypothetical protein PMPD1_3747 [Paramixta manurensis]|uniref:Uncharacterized protein n=1 Tax=Paramixta manurensis TaxID=2740817 RepID=A0A6M8UID1_9GAMM|nr:hypothetical protein PMPD1_3747 [Erwiniaceae bacterium PD-1]
MPNSISNFPHNNLMPVSHPLSGAVRQDTTQLASQTVAATPGNGVARVHGQPVAMTAMNQSGFTSAFSTSRTGRLAQRANLPVAPTHHHHVMSQQAGLAERAKNDMQAIEQLVLNQFPATSEILHAMSQQHVQQFTPHQIDQISEAIDDYQGAYGDNFLMNISAMGYPTIESYLQARDPIFNDAEEVNEFIGEFGYRYGGITGMMDEEEEIEELRTRLEDRLTEPAQVLSNFIHTSPRISGVPLLKGATGGDNPVTTQLDGGKTLRAMLDGQALNFNGFLSTTSSYKSALEFSGKMSQTGLGNAMYTVDLTSDSTESEILRRETLRALDRGECAAGSILFYFKTDNVAGISVNATQRAANPGQDESRLNSEDEILLAPGHFFEPEQIVRNDDGFAVIGSLKYGRN